MVLSASLLDRLITDLDLGVQTVVGERGSRLSGGQHSVLRLRALCIQTVLF